MMNELIARLRVCDKSIEHWMDSRLHLAGTKKSELWYWHGERGTTLAGLRYYRSRTARKETR